VYKIANPFELGKVSRLLYLVPIVVMFAFTIFFHNLTIAIDDSLMHEKFEEKKLAVATMANHTDSFIRLDHDWENSHEYYKQSLIFDMEILDTAVMTYAAVFDEDLNQLSKQSNYTGGFNPLIYPSVRQAIRDHESGDMRIIFSPEVGGKQNIFMHYRWIPTGRNHDNRFLVIVGISKETIVTQTAEWYLIGSVALIAVTTLLNFTMVFIIIKSKEANTDDR